MGTKNTKQACIFKNFSPLTQNQNATNIFQNLALVFN